jgi:hypothetical protein
MFLNKVFSGASLYRGGGPLAEHLTLLSAGEQGEFRLSFSVVQPNQLDQLAVWRA